jgi:hypothetical protein
MRLGAIVAMHPPQATTAEKLHRLMGKYPAGKIGLGDIVDDLGAAGMGLCLLLFSLASLIPGVAPVFGLALCALAFGIVLGHAEPVLPERLRRWQMDRDRVDAGLRRLAPIVSWMERWLRPRTKNLLRGPGVRLIGLASLINGILVVLPIPFGNTAPAVAMLILSLGMVVGDGIAVGVGLLATAVALVVDIGMIGLGYTALTAMIEHLF